MSTDQTGQSAVRRAVEAFADGRAVYVHDFDDREGETDLLVPAGAVDRAAVARLRNEAGGLPFVALSAAVAEAYDLPFLHDAIDHPTNDHGDLRYDARPSFSLTVNHRDTYTGVTDDDRALTMRRLADAARAAADADARGTPVGFDFAAEFRTPGHVHLLRAAPRLLAERRGHTELGVALAEAAGVPPAVAGAEVLDDERGGALPVAEARALARRRDAPFVTGDELVAELG